MQLRRIAITSFTVVSTVMAQAPGTHIHLPKNTVIHLGASYARKGEEGEDCGDFRFTKAAIRRRFRTYHVLATGEEHDSYSELPCLMDGTLKVGKKSYKFTAVQGNRLSSNYPGPGSAMLGGAPSGGADDTVDDPDLSPIPRKRR